jgi:hypothetical protein
MECVEKIKEKFFAQTPLAREKTCLDALLHKQELKKGSIISH